MTIGDKLALILRVNAGKRDFTYLVAWSAEIEQERAALEAMEAREPKTPGELDDIAVRYDCLASEVGRFSRSMDRLIDLLTREQVIAQRQAKRRAALH